MNYGLTPGDAFDLTTGRDFDKEQDRDQAMKILRESKPRLIVGSPECTMFSNLQNLSGWNERKEAILKAAKRHLDFMCQIYKEQLERGGWFLHEHPVSASSWRE